MVGDLIYSIRESIKYDTREFSIEEILTRCRSKEISIDRYDLSWTETGKSKYIEAILGGYPLLPLVFKTSERDAKVLLPVEKEGNNKLQALLDFQDNYVLAYENKVFKEYSPYWQRKFLNTSLKCIIFEQATSADVIYRIRNFIR